MTQRRVTMADVARLAGVSTTAVSLVLNNRQGTRISDDVASRVRAAAQELGYRPNLTARALSTQKSHVIGFISEQVTTDRLASGLIRGALQEAKRHNHVLFIAETEGESHAVDEAVDALTDRQVDGIIYAATRPQTLRVPARVGSTPVVMLNAVSDDVADNVLADEFAGAKDIVDLLLESGHTDGVVIVGRSMDQPDDEWLSIAVRRRLAGIWDSLSAHGVRPVAQIPCQPWSVRSGYEAVRDLLLAGVQPHALICMNDRLAFGAYRALSEVHLTPGRDVSVVSFDDDDIAVYLHPMLTTAAAPFEDMGALAVRILLDNNHRPGEHLVPMPLRVRDSVHLNRATEAEFTAMRNPEPDWTR
ncbi:LacI family DNA-binding transcriptional regulator [Agromyces sp. ISL-38]|uniref:LacI family DNA-binding transcriptional regulator n=1 Tax=Agromyces sp. ISL-38 TaxID=2819107 RepID=UPI001BE70575|nr:LacI family DNA-binding transcriptional regulator [Agromyces sp. ISL-38]MBT2498353.1 LacI family DNA-binding transcriptional regulator [Agromyces sp. ISL-38]MBT2519013.1 LacI family DNA-binding transcriptional regulator [Streptomyces sp. ISL-90]